MAVMSTRGPARRPPGRATVAKVSKAVKATKAPVMAMPTMVNADDYLEPSTARVEIVGESRIVTTRIACGICGKKFKKGNAVFVVPGVDWMTDRAFMSMTHRRCVEEIFRDGPRDVDVDTFDAYRLRLVEQYQ